MCVDSLTDNMQVTINIYFDTAAWQDQPNVGFN